MLKNSGFEQKKKVLMGKNASNHNITCGKFSVEKNIKYAEMLREFQSLNRRRKTCLRNGLKYAP